MDFVFTTCDSAAQEACPVWPGQPITAHWGVPDPAAAEGDEVRRMLAFREVFAMLERRVILFVTLPFHALDRMALQREAAAIGRNAARAPRTDA
jgi:arsenate reductase